jgi:hypothetical protein
MSKYKVTDKYTVVGESGEPKLTKKYRRKSSTGRGDLHPKSRSLSLGSLNAPQLTVVEITEPLRSPKLPLGKRSSMEIDYLQFHHLAAKGNPLVYDNMYGYKVGSIKSQICLGFTCVCLNFDILCGRSDIHFIV